MRIINVVGARPNFMKIAPLMDAYASQPDIEPLLVHTGQHYDEQMSDLFFRQLGIPEPDVNLGVGSASHAVQTAGIMKAFEPVLEHYRPDAVLVVGDVNSTVACGLVAVKMGAALVHAEAGLRSFDRRMPEEINRRVTDALSDVLLCTEKSAVENLRHEGVSDHQVFFVGNLMIDTLQKNREKATASDVLDRLGLQQRGYGVLTLHRPSNVDDPSTLGRLLEAVEDIQHDLPLVFPAHPRTRHVLETGPFGERVRAMPNLRLIPPAGYLDFLHLMDRAQFVLTDSGGIQEETTILGVPCLTLRENTERPITVEMGTNQLVGTDSQRILVAYRDVRQGKLPAATIPPLWDGRAAERIVELLGGLSLRS